MSMLRVTFEPTIAVFQQPRPTTHVTHATTPNPLKKRVERQRERKKTATREKKTCFCIHRQAIPGQTGEQT
jgi:hypothetical protein